MKSLPTPDYHLNMVGEPCPYPAVATLEAMPQLAIGEVLEVMEGLAREGMTMICVTHEMGFARKVADTMIFMDRGEIVEQAPPQVFFDNPQNERTKLFLGQILH